VKNRLKIERAIKDLTQEGLARLVGVSRQTINSIEKNRYVKKFTQKKWRKHYNLHTLSKL
jgi:DNA-binding XRE family transcriptional regulator